jgi:riboflavin synthase alpha subunit
MAVFPVKSGAYDPVMPDDDGADKRVGVDIACAALGQLDGHFHISHVFFVQSIISLNTKTLQPQWLQGISQIMHIWFVLIKNTLE